MRRGWLWAALLVFAAGAGWLGWRAMAPHLRSTQDFLWAPLANSGQPLTIAVGDSFSYGSIVASPPDNAWALRVQRIIDTREVEQISPPAGTMSPPLLSIVDSKVLARISGTLATHHRTAEIRGSSATTLVDLKHGPDVIIGAFDNPWFLILLSNLRYHVAVDPATQDEWIADAMNPGNRAWKTSGKLIYADSEPDYALIARVQSPETGNWILALGGIGMHGTEAAGDLITDPKYAALLPASLRTENKNVEIVLKTTVINGNTGPPQIVAVYTW